MNGSSMETVFQKDALQIQRESLGVSKIGLAVQVSSVVVALLGVFFVGSNIGFSSMVAVLAFLYLTFTSGLVFLHLSRSSNSFNWRDYMSRIRLLEAMRMNVEIVKGSEGRAIGLSYDMSVRFLCMLAMTQGRPDIAEVLWKHYQLPSSRKRALNLGQEELTEQEREAFQPIRRALAKDLPS